MTLTVNADSEEEAFDAAKSVLEVFPRPCEYNGSVPYCYIENRTFHSTEVVNIKDMKEDDSD